MSKEPNNAIVVDTATKRLTALKACVKNNKAEIAIDGVVHKAAAVIAIYQNSLDTRAAVNTKRAETKAAMAERAEAETARRAADRALKPWVINQFGAGSQQAIDFGFPPAKVPVRTVETKVHAVLQGKATREARGTMGPKAKLKIKGVVSTSTAPAAPASNVAPAASVAASAPAPTASPAVSVSTPAAPPAASVPAPAATVAPSAAPAVTASTTSVVQAPPPQAAAATPSAPALTNGVTNGAATTNGAPSH